MAFSSWRGPKSLSYPVASGLNFKVKPYSEYKCIKGVKSAVLQVWPCRLDCPQPRLTSPKGPLLKSLGPLISYFGSVLIIEKIFPALKLSFLIIPDSRLPIYINTLSSVCPSDAAERSVCPSCLHLLFSPKISLVAVNLQRHVFRVLIRTFLYVILLIFLLLSWK